MEDEAGCRRLLAALRGEPGGSPGRVLGGAPGAASEALRLARLVSRYGQAIEADLAQIGVDLGHLWRTRQWRRLLNLVDHLPRHSYFVEALSDDEELAAQAALSLPRHDDNTGPRLSEWSPDHELLVRIGDLIGDLIAITVAANSKGGNAPTIPHYPRPVTAIERARQRAAYATHERLTRRLLPPEGG